MKLWDLLSFGMLVVGEIVLTVKIEHTWEWFFMRLVFSPPDEEDF